MKDLKKILFLFSILIPILSVGQEKEKDSEKKTFKKVYNQQFSNLITGQSNTSIGSFGSLNIAEPEVSYGQSLIAKNGGVFSIKGSGGISDGLFTIFDNSTFNTKVSIDVKYNFPFLNKDKLQWKIDSIKQHEEQKSKILATYEKMKSEVTYNQPRDLLKREKEKHNILITDLIIKRDEELANETTMSQELVDSLNYEVDILKLSVDTTIEAIKRFTKYKELSLTNIENWRTQQLILWQDSKKIVGFNFTWVTLGYKVQNNSFKLFNSSLVPDSQIIDTSFITHGVQIQLSHYKWSIIPFESSYYNVGFEYNHADNLADLKKIEINDVKNYSSTPNERTSTKKYNAYTGDYLSRLKSVRIYIDYFKFLFKKNTAAIHGFSEFNAKTYALPTYNLGAGFLYSFKDSKDESTVLNAEIYYNFIDLFKTTEDSGKLFERNNIGLKFVFPIKFKIN